MADTHDLNIIMNIDDGEASIEYMGKIVRSNFRVVQINQFNKMASFSYYFNENKKWVFKWIVWNEREQFFGFDEYHKLNDKDDPWTELAKWSYISKPQMGTCQTNDVHKMFYKSYLFPEVNKINFSIEGSPYGDWNNMK